MQPTQPRRPKVGDRVIYRLNEPDIAAAAQAAGNHGRYAPGLIGALLQADVTHVFDGTEALCNLSVLLDDDETGRKLTVTSRPFGGDPGRWSWSA